MRDSFRRADIGFTREGVMIDTDDLTEAQMQAINDEPLLVVYAVDDDGKPVATAEGGGKPSLAKTAKQPPAKPAKEPAAK
jgi:hypothetical protein